MQPGQRQPNNECNRRGDGEPRDDPRRSTNLHERHDEEWRRGGASEHDGVLAAHAPGHAAPQHVPDGEAERETEREGPDRGSELELK